MSPTVEDGNYQAIMSEFLRDGSDVSLDVQATLYMTNDDGPGDACVWQQTTIAHATT